VIHGITKIFKPKKKKKKILTKKIIKHFCFEKITKWSNNSTKWGYWVVKGRDCGVW
jgi:hypothetical protein